MNVLKQNRAEKAWISSLGTPHLKSRQKFCYTFYRIYPGHMPVYLQVIEHRVNRLSLLMKRAMKQNHQQNLAAKHNFDPQVLKALGQSGFFKRKISSFVKSESSNLDITRM